MNNILIIHYNTPELTNALIKSINKFCKDSNVYIFDNSNRRPFINNFKNVTVFDNTKGKYINFNNELRKYPNRNKSLGRASNFGSFKHCISVQKCFDLINEDFILLDADVLLKKDISELYNNEYIFSGEIRDWSWSLNNKMYPKHKRIVPFICYINLPLCKKKGYTYFDDKHMDGLYNPDLEADSWDTGCWFYEQCKNEKYNEIICDDYIVHFGGGSYLKMGRCGMSAFQWLNKNRNLYE